MSRLMKNRSGLMAYLPKDVVFKLGWSKQTEVIIFANPSNPGQVIVEKLWPAKEVNPLPAQKPVPQIIKSAPRQITKENGVSHGVRYWYSDGTTRFVQKRFEPFT